MGFFLWSGADTALLIQQLMLLIYELENSSPEPMPFADAPAIQGCPVQGKLGFQPYHTPPSVSDTLDQEGIYLHPLLVTEMRDECTTVPILDASLVPNRPDRSHGLLG